jgi:hypothetical protein
VRSGTLSNTLQVMKKRGVVNNAGGKWKLASPARSARTLDEASNAELAG